MSVVLSFCPSFTSPPAPAQRTAPASAKGTLLLGASAALAAAAVLAFAQPKPTPSSGAYSAATLVAGQATSPAALMQTAEAFRARLLQVSGVGSVGLRGLQAGGVDVDYTPARLARFGLTVADLRAALPVQAGPWASGRLTIKQDAARSGPQPIADMPVRISGKVFRVGDVAAVARTVLASPVAMLPRADRLSVELLVTPASGADNALERRVAAELAEAALPADIRLR